MKMVLVSAILLVGCGSNPVVRAWVDVGGREVTLSTEAPNTTASVSRSAERFYLVASIPEGSDFPQSPIRLAVKITPDGQTYSTQYAPRQSASLFFRDLTGPQPVNCFDPTDGWVAWSMEYRTERADFHATCSGVQISGAIEVSQ